MEHKLGIGCRCSYRDCPNTTHTSDAVSFFHFPVKNQHRCMRWIENAQKPLYFDLEEEDLKNKVVCHEHFEDRWFVKNSPTRRLLPGSVPTLNGRSKQNLLYKESDTGYNQTGFKSSQYKDVQIRPTNEDKTVFVLDAENMFTESNKIESYVIKNGQLVPSSQVKKIANKPKASRPYTNLVRPPLNKYQAATVQPTSRRDEPPVKIIKKDPILREQLNKEVTIKKEIIDPLDPLAIEVTRKNYNAKPKVPDQISAEYQDFDSIEVHYQSDSNQDSKTSLEKSYLKKIKQHSKEIASIKKMLAQKTEKPDVNMALNAIEEKLPTTVVTIISLLLGIKNDLNEADVEFFTTLHRTSPEAYQLLSDKYNWNLPSVDVVETED